MACGTSDGPLSFLLIKDDTNIGATGQGFQHRTKLQAAWRLRWCLWLDLETSFRV